MIIGVDAGALSITDDRLKVGAHRVTLNCLLHLAQLDTNNTYRLYSFLPIEQGIVNGLGKNFLNIVLPKRGWSLVWLPLELKRHPVDVFLGLSQMLPYSSSYNIGFMYDLGFLHHPEAYPDSYRRLTKQTETLIRRADHIFAISHAVSDDIQERYTVASDVITVSYPGIDKRMTPIGDTHRGPNPYFLSVGALKRAKNIPTAIRAFADFLIKIKRPFDYYLVGGDYWMDPDISKMILQYDLYDRVKLLGYVADDLLASYYRGAVALVAPSLWEGFCLPAAEAMACGCPVIGSDTGAIPEIVGDAGLLVDPGDRTALAKAIDTMANNEKARSSFIKKGLKNAKRFSWKSMGETVYNLITNFHKASPFDTERRTPLLL